MVRVSFVDLEDKLLELLTKIKRRSEMLRKGIGVGKAKKKVGKGKARELRRLQFSVNYDNNKKGSRGERENDSKK